MQWRNLLSNSVIVLNSIDLLIYPRARPSHFSACNIEKLGMGPENEANNIYWGHFNLCHSVIHHAGINLY